MGQLNLREAAVVLASGNPGKAREFRALLGPWGCGIVCQSELGVAPAEENGLSFVENALIKARHAAAQTGLMALADDSGLCVQALNDAPGIYSSRLAGGDQANNHRLLSLLEHVRPGDRGARYVCALVFLRSADDPLPLIVQESWRGEIALEPRGAGGFGYDPLFYLRDRDLTAAELPPETKNLLSHRGRALRHLVRLLTAGSL